MSAMCRGRQFLLLRFASVPPLLRCLSVPSAISAATDSDTSSILKGRMPPDQPREYPSELPVLALRETVVFPLTLQPLAITRPMSIESVNRALAGDRLLFLALQTTERRGRRSPSDLKTIGTIAAIRQMAKVPNGGIHVIVEGLARARADVMTRQRPGAARDGDAGAGTDRAHARSRRVRAAPPRADRSRAVGHERAVAGTARAGRPASTIRCGSPICSRACST